MAHFSSISFTIKTNQPVPEADLKKAFGKIGVLKDMKVSDKTVTGTAPNSKSIDKLVAALKKPYGGASLDKTVYNFDFTTDEKTPAASYEAVKGSRSLAGVQAEVTVHGGKVVRAKGTAISEPNLKGLWQLLGGN